MTDDADIEKKLATLRREHGNLERQIEERSRGHLSDLTEVQRLKKEKLALKDRIATLEKSLPDIIA